MKQSKSQSLKKGVRVGLLIAALGFLIFILGVEPDLFRLNRSPVIGFAQITVLSFGLAIMCLGGYISLNASRPAAHERSLVEDVGLRLVATGYLVSFISALADVFGLGTQSWPALPFLGPSQAIGVMAGEILIAIGFIMFIPKRNDS
ncbi:MAG: hypothetical protein B6I38_01305 [Anaerolineaceae bacterium 4572_5.1]|nr:MAG: hypothetical protein B5M51_08530 [Anaerolinea sp. 4484_236]OQY35772.1 MAG: hypothetical protein B6I38_01305 [Anaerolineaceae bacterium 4572_5.1]RLD11124.1 MAG: hypothetical protein DRI56_01595 [Chloroflexota bacterium]